MSSPECVEEVRVNVRRRGEDASATTQMPSPPFVTLLHKPARPFGAVPELDATRVGAGGKGGEEGVHVVRDGRQPECAGSEEKKKWALNLCTPFRSLSRGTRATNARHILILHAPRP